MSEELIFPTEEAPSPTGLPSSYFAPVEKTIVKKSIALSNMYQTATNSPTDANSIARNAELLQDNGLEATMQAVAAHKQASDTEAVKEVINTTPFSNKAILTEAIDTLKSLSEINNIEKPPPDIIEQEYLQNVAWGVDIEKRQEGGKSLAWLNTINKKAQEAGEEASFFQYVVDIGREIINPGWASKTAYDALADSLGKESLGFFEGRFTTNTDLVESFRSTLSTASPEEQELIVGKLLKNLEANSAFFTDKDNVVISKALSLILASTKEDRNWDVGFNLLGAATLPGVSTLVNVTAKLARPAAVLATIGEGKEASKLIAKDILAKSGDNNLSGLSETEQIESILPLYQSPLRYTVSSLKGISAEGKLSIIEQESGKTFQNILNFKAETGITEEEVKAFTEEVKKNLSGQYLALEHRAIELEQVAEDSLNVHVDYQHHLGRPFFTEKEATRWATKRNMVDYKVVPDEKGFLIKAVENVSLTKSGISARANSDIFGWNFPFDPKQALSKELTDSRVVSLHKTAKLREEMITAYDESLKGISGKGKQRIASLIAKGDSESDSGLRTGHTYNLGELEALGVMDKAEQNAYWKVRNIRNLLYQARDKALIDSFNFLGYKKISLEDEAGKTILEGGGEKFSLQQANALSSSGEVRKFLDIDKNSPVELTSSSLKELYDKGYSIVKLMEPETRGTARYPYVLMRDSRLKVSDWREALNYRDGEIGRIYTDPYFTMFKYKGTVSGIEKELYTTVATSSTKQGAASWVKSHNSAMQIARDYLQGKKGYSLDYKKGIARDAKGKFVKGGIVTVETQIYKELAEHIDNPDVFFAQIKKGDIPLEAEFDFKFDRESHGYSEMRIKEHLDNGRLFTSKRGEHLLSVEGGAAPVKSVVESLAEEISSVSRFVTLDKWKHVQIQRWLTSVGKNITNTGEGAYSDFMKGELKYAVGTPEHTYFTREREYIKNQLGFKSKSQEWVQQKGRNFAEWIEGGSATAHKMALSMRDKDPIAVLKAMNYHTTLGLGNLGQLLVQASGAFVAATLHPLYGLKAAQSAAIYRLALMTDNEAVIAKLAGMDSIFNLGVGGTKDFKEAVEAIRRSGILSSIKSTALYDAGEGAIDLGFKANAVAASLLTSSRKLGSTLLDVGLIPFNRGEEMSRMIAFDIARREWKAANKGASVLSEKALKEITARMDDYTMGMTHANRMQIQKGFLSIPFQFAQYPIKLMSALAGKKSFTAKERMKILTGQTLLYGTGAFGIRSLAEELMGEEASALDQDTKLAITQGGASWLISALSDEELQPAIGSRLGAGGMFTSMYRGFFEGDSSAVDMTLGPTKNLFQKTTGITADLLTMFQRNEDVTWDEVKYGLSKLGEVSAGWKSWKDSSRILFAKDVDKYLRNSGQYKTVEASSSQAIMKLLGFPDVKETEQWETFRSEKARRDKIADVANTMAELWVLKADYLSEGNTTMSDEVGKQIAAIPSMLSYAEWKEMTAEANKIVSKRSGYEQMLLNLNNRAYEEMGRETLSPILPPTSFTE